jgi:hypothetical protein
MSGNTVVGGYYDAIFNLHGFVNNGSTITTVDVPGAASTLIFGIDGNNIVGYYDDSKGGSTALSARRFLFLRLSFSSPPASPVSLRSASAERAGQHRS